MPSPIWGSIFQIQTTVLPIPRFPALSRRDTTYPWNTVYGGHIHEIPLPMYAPMVGASILQFLLIRNPWQPPLCPQTGTEKHQTVAKEQAKGRQTRAKIGQGDAKGTPRAQNGGQGRRQRAPTPPLASPKTAQHRPKAVPKLAQKYATRRKRETVVENWSLGLRR